MREKIGFFHKLVYSNYPLYLWSYDASFELVDTTATWNLISFADFVPVVSSHLATGSFSPVILGTNVNMCWMVGFAHKNEKLDGIHFLGPILTGEDTPALLREKLETYDLSVRTRATVTKMMSRTPIIPTSMLVNYAVMMHYALNEENIPLSEVKFLPEGEARPTARQGASKKHEGVWLEEQRLCQMFEEGDPAAVSAIMSALSVTSGVDARIKDFIRKHKNNALVLLTLCSRSCIRGGLHPAVAYDLNDYYATVLEECRTASEVVRFCKDMVSDFMGRMEHAKVASSISPPIQNACYYIRNHLTESLSIESLAKLVGYTEYYFSYKFQKETGVTVKDFILDERITQAKILLSDSNQSVQDVSDALGFCNRSYFSTCFRKKVGMSPNQYKAQHAKV